MGYSDHEYFAGYAIVQRPESGSDPGIALSGPARLQGSSVVLNRLLGRGGAGEIS